MVSVSYATQKKKRPIFLVGETPAGGVLVEVPLLGRISAGQPIDICSERESVAVPANMVHKNTYALRVKGHSMIDDNIREGDIVVIEKRETAESGQSVVAMINGESVTLKKFYIERSGIRLQPANPALKPIYLRNDEVQILGIVTGVVRRPPERAQVQ